MQHRVKTTSVKTWLVWSHAWSYNITCFSFKLRSNGQQKRAIYFATLLQNALKSDVARITTHLRACLVTNQVVASCVNTDFWLDKITRDSHYTRELRHFLQIKFALRRQNVQHVQSLLEKVELLATFCNHFSQLAASWFGVGQVWCGW